MGSIDPTSATGELSIPIIDLEPIRSGSPEEALAAGKEIYEAFRDVGFAYIRNHGVPQSDIDQAFAWSAKFFSLPPETKALAPHPPRGDHHRGYSGPGLEKVSQMVFDPNTLTKLRSSQPDFKESFELGRPTDTATPNIWLPEERLPGFRAFMLSFFSTCDTAAKTLLRGIELGMSLPPGLLTGFHTRQDNQLRLLHYPSVETQLLQDEKIERIAAHTDFGTMTLLFQDQVGGLEVEDRHISGKFNPAPYVEGTLVVNIGDFLMRWSNEELKSTLHRVRAPPPVDKLGTSPSAVSSEQGQTTGMTKERYSMPYFVTADREKVVDCLPGCWGEGRPKKYDPVTSGEYVAMRLNATY